MDQTFIDYLKILNIPVSRKYFRKRVASHPDYPSLLSISDTFGQLGIPHTVARIDRDGLVNTDFPYVLYLLNDAKEFFIVKDENDLKKTPELREDWNGVAFRAETVGEINDDENRRYLRREKAVRIGSGLLIMSLLFLFTLLIFVDFSWPFFMLLATAIAGAVLGFLLVAKDLGVTFDTVESFCSSGKQTNCDRVLNSEQARLFGGFSVSDAVLTYFIVQLMVTGILISLSEIASALIWVLAVAAVMTIPVVGYSLWLQGMRFKAWCRLCLLVAGVLVIQAGLFRWMYAVNFLIPGDASWWAAGLVAGLLTVAGSLVFLIKTRLEDGRKDELYLVASNRIKYNPGVFVQLLLQENWSDCTPFEREMLIGTPDAPVQITMAASLGCGPCKEGFEKAVQVVKRWPEQVNLSVRLYLSNYKKNAEINNPGGYLLNIWQQNIYGKENQSEKTVKLLNDWYATKNLDQFKEKYSQESSKQIFNVVKENVNLHANWVKREGLSTTPAFYINGYLLPYNYNIEEISWLFPELPEQMSSIKDLAQNSQSVLV